MFIIFSDVAENTILVAARKTPATLITENKFIIIITFAVVVEALPSFNKDVARAMPREGRFS
jgi:hypothetical protein